MTFREQPVTESPPTPAPAGARRKSGPRSIVPWLVIGCYLLAAVVGTGRLWIDPASRVQAGDRFDIPLFAWFMRYAATAVAHGHLPDLVSSALNAPYGVNVMWNTSFLLPGVLLTPVTLLFGPQVSLTLVLTLGFAGSAASLFWVVRRWGASLGAAALGGAVYGFSPALFETGLGHYHLQFAVLPPLIVDAALRLVTGRGRPVRTGIWLGLMCAAQIFIGEELLLYTVITVVVVVAIVVISRPRMVPGRIRDSVTGLVTAAVLFLVLDGYALWMQFKGPFAEHGKLALSHSGNLAWFVVPSSQVLFHTQSSAAEAVAILQGPSEYVSYLGWPLIVVLVAAGAVFWRDLRVRVGALTLLVLELCALGGGNLRILGFQWPGRLLPWHWLQGLPGLAEVLPWRFSILADGAAAVVLVFALDRALNAVPRTRSWQRPALVAIAVLAVLPLLPLPYDVTNPPPVPAGWQATFTRLDLQQDAPVLVLPFPAGIDPEAENWQAVTGQPGSLIGGYFLAPGPTGQPSFYFANQTKQTEVALYLYRVWAGIHSQGPSDAQIRAVIGTWRTAAIVVDAGQRSAIAHLLTHLFGKPTYQIDSMLSWKL